MDKVKGNDNIIIDIKDKPKKIRRMFWKKEKRNKYGNKETIKKEINIDDVDDF